MDDLKVDAELKALIRPLSERELARLEQSILNEGIRDPLVVWEGEDILLDGHHRYEIAQEHDLPFSVSEVALPDRDAAKVWMIRNQLGRRNLTTYQKAELALELEPLLAEKAKERKAQAPGQPRGTKQASDVQNSAQENKKTRDELAETAGVSHDTISGTATTGVVALREGCDYWGIDLSEEYQTMARRRLNEAVTGVPEKKQAALAEHGLRQDALW